VSVVTRQTNSENSEIFRKEKQRKAKKSEEISIKNSDFHKIAKPSPKKNFSQSKVFNGKTSEIQKKPIF